MVVVGFGIGVLYFVGLFKTLDLVVIGKKNLKLWMFVSFLIRSTLLIGVFFLLSKSDWRRVAALVVGFMVARLMMVRRVRGAMPVTEKVDAS